LLHELLCTNDQFGFPTTYACLNPHHFILTQKRALARPGGQFRRPQDRMMVSPQMPQEDEFALLCLGARSPYEGLLAPRNFAEALSLADPDDLTDKDRRRWRKTFDEFFRGVSLVSGGKPLVLKSPTHSYRVATLRELLPDARFILIVRDPHEVFGSMVRTYQTLSNKYGLGPSLADDEIRHVLLSERLRFEAKLLAGVNGLPGNRFTTVKYEHLVRDPLSVIERVYEQLELSGFEQARPKLVAEVAKRSDYVQSRTRVSEDWKRRVREQWRDIFEYYGYP
jgi:omega-hydroxy-beta-dihydromenaquinone-9 sulfotransferase